MVVNLAAVALCNFHLFAAWLFQDNSSVGWDPISLWKQMGLLAKAGSSFCSSCRGGRLA